MVGLLLNDRIKLMQDVLYQHNAHCANMHLMLLVCCLIAKQKHQLDYSWSSKEFEWMEHTHTQGSKRQYCITLLTCLLATNKTSACMFTVQTAVWWDWSNERKSSQCYWNLVSFYVKSAIPWRPFLIQMHICNGTYQYYIKHLASKECKSPTLKLLQIFNYSTLILFLPNVISVRSNNYQTNAEQDNWNEVRHLWV